MLTIPRRYPFPSPAGEYRATCDYCGMKWYRRASGMFRDASGLLTCPDCDDGGRDTVTLDRLNAEGADQVSTPRTVDKP